MKFLFDKKLKEYRENFLNESINEEDEGETLNRDPANEVLSTVRNFLTSSDSEIPDIHVEIYNALTQKMESEEVYDAVKYVVDSIAKGVLKTDLPVDLLVNIKDLAYETISNMGYTPERDATGQDDPFDRYFQEENIKEEEGEEEPDPQQKQKQKKIKDLDAKISDETIKDKEEELRNLKVN